MNKTHRIIYSQHTGTYVAVAEIVSAKGKAKSITPCTKPTALSITELSIGVTGRFKSLSASMSLMGILSLLTMPIAHASYVNTDSSGTTPYGSVAGGTPPITGRIAIGADSAANQMAYASANNAIAVGANARASGDSSVAMGVNAIASGGSSVAMGGKASASCDQFGCHW